MSNNYNSTLQSNNIDLQAILDTINELPEADSGGDTSMEDGLVARTLTKYENNRAEIIGPSVFGSFTTLTEVNMPKCKEIGISAFYYCSNLTTASFPKVTTIGGYAFNRTNLYEAVFPLCTTIGDYAFGRDVNLTKADFPLCTTIGNYAFASCSQLSTINLPVCSSIGSAAFSGCSMLQEADFPYCTMVKQSTFMSCSSLARANFPKCTAIYMSGFQDCGNLVETNFEQCVTVGSKAFWYCTKLPYIDLPKCTYINNSAFYQCGALSAIYLLGNSVCGMAGSMTFYNTGNNVGGYSVFVPASLVNKYKSSTNWAYHSSHIAAYGIVDMVDNKIAINSTESITINTYFRNIPTNISITPLNTENISISNIQATTSNITFDVSSNNIEGEFNIEVRAVENGITLKNTFTLTVINPIRNLTLFGFTPNSTKTATIPLDNNDIIPDNVSITSDNNILSINNITYDSKNIIFDVTSYSVESIAIINISVTYGNSTYNRESTIAVTSTPYYIVQSLITDYTFTLNSDGYYESNNSGRANSFAICQLNIMAPYACTLYLDCILSSQNKYDYGILSTLNSTLTLSKEADTSNVYKSFKALSGDQIVSYSIPEGEHYIYIKYIKDYGGDTGRDSLQFKVRFE